MAMQDFKVRLPKGIAEMVQEIADDEGYPVATYLQQIISQGVRHQVAMHANSKASVALDSFVDLATKESARIMTVEKPVTPPQQDNNVRSVRGRRPRK